MDIVPPDPSSTLSHLPLPHLPCPFPGLQVGFRGCKALGETKRGKAVRLVCWTLSASRKSRCGFKATAPVRGQPGATLFPPGAGSPGLFIPLGSPALRTPRRTASLCATLRTFPGLSVRLFATRAPEDAQEDYISELNYLIVLETINLFYFVLCKSISTSYSSFMFVPEKS